jgi:hypothetical protein
VDLDNYEAFLSRNQEYLLVAVNLDIIPGSKHGIATRNETEDACIQSYERWLRLRKTGVEVMPVVHQTDDPDWLYRYIDEGAVCVGISPSDLMPPLARNHWLLDVHDHMRCNGVALGQSVFTHILGVFAPSSLHMLKGLAWSADASTIMQHSVNHRLMVPMFNGEISHGDCFGSYATVYVGERTTVSSKNAKMNADEIETYLCAIGHADHYERDRDRIVIPNLYAIASANLKLAHRVNLLTGVRAFIAGPDTRVMRQIVVEEQYPYILRTFADITDNAIRDYYYRDLKIV